LKELGAQWLVKMVQYIEDNPQFVVNGFVKAGISRALNNDTADLSSDESGSESSDDTYSEDSSDLEESTSSEESADSEDFESNTSENSQDYEHSGANKENEFTVLSD